MPAVLAEGDAVGRLNFAKAAFAFAAGLAVASASEATERVALVIGNSAYANVPALANPLNDASDIGDALDRLGFSVTRIENADQAALRQSLQEFQRAASASDIAVVFYAGHGMEVDQRNFLVPVDARLVSDQDIEFEAVPLELVSRAVARASKLRLVVLDACRDNPFAIRMQRAGATRSIGRGLARVEPPGETLVAYAAKEGTVASDGAGRNSPYSAALLAHLEEPGLEVGMLFRKVRDAVVRETGGRQEPFVYGSLSSEGVYFSARLAPERDSVKPPAGGAPGEASASGPGAVAAIPAAAETAARAYEAAERLHTLEGYEAVAERFPGSIFADLARGQIRKLSGEGVEGATASAPLESPSSGLGPESLELDRLEWRLVQVGLASLGFDPGPADGLIGRGTRGAIGRLQASRGLEATGYLDVELRKELLAEAEASKRLRPGSVFRDCAACPEMVVVPAGSFMMGSPASEEGRRESEGPVHRVEIRKPFAVGKYEVTFAEWDACVSAGDCGGYRPGDRGWGRGRRPVVNVNWEDAKSYVSWLSRKSGEAYRLLSESEWEYAARAGTTGPFHFGSTISTDQANYDGALAYGSGGKGVYRGKTVLAGSFPANGFNLHDMHGNVWEWVEDCWNDSYAGAPSDGSVWTSGDCSARVLRGGSWSFEPRYVRSAGRGRNSTGFRSYFFGFRVARILD